MKVCIACGNRLLGETWNCSCGFTPGSINGFRAFAPELSEASEGFEAHFFEHLAALEAKNFWFRSRNRLIIWALRYYFPTAKSLLEIGCGTGFVLAGIEQSFPNLRLCASEVFTRGLEFADRRVTRAELFQMDARQIPFDCEFDVVGAFDVIEHIYEDVRVLQQLYQATCPGGGILLTLPQHPWLWSQADDYAHHVRRYEAKELQQKVQHAGFQILRMTSFVSFLLPIMLASRLRQKKVTSPYDPTAELKISGWMNGMLESILTLERYFIQSGVSFPAGGSLLLIAQKPKN